MPPIPAPQDSQPARKEEPVQGGSPHTHSSRVHVPATLLVMDRGPDNALNFCTSALSPKDGNYNPIFSLFYKNVEVQMTYCK